MKIAGVQKFSAVDYPGKLACVIFTAGCNFKCPYCHNADLISGVIPEGFIYEEDVLTFLKNRIGKLKGVVISGGEPTLQSDLVSFSKYIKSLGYDVMIATNGSRSHTIHKLIEEKAVDYVGLDIKAPKKEYAQFLDSKNKNLSKPYTDSIATTIEYCNIANINVDIRTTVHKSILSIEQLTTMRDELVALQITDWYLQQYHNSVGVLDKSLNAQETYTDSGLSSIAAMLSTDKIKVHTRGIFDTKYIHD